MKIAVPTRGTQVDEHFGHCEMYTVFTFSDDKKIEKEELIPSPQGCGCKSNIASVLQAQGVKVMLAGNMGGGAVNVLTQHGIAVVRGCSGDVKQIAEEYIQGLVEDSGVSCASHSDHGEGHSCEHHN
jgi:predicted Fe-Mo cluster-binding NifX family protein